MSTFYKGKFADLFITGVIDSSHVILLFFRYIVCKGLRINSQDVHDHMFNVNVRINRMKQQDIEDVVEVSGNYYSLIYLRRPSFTYKASTAIV